MRGFLRFSENQVVIHPHHGPATVTGLLSRTLRGKRVAYAELTIQQTGMTCMVPVDRAEEIGIRGVADTSALERLAGVLAAPSGDQEMSWARRFKAQRELVNSGDPLRIAAVVRDLIRRRERGHISPSEKELLQEASARLLAEVALAVSVDEDHALDVVERLVVEGSSAVLQELQPVG